MIKRTYRPLLALAFSAVLVLTTGLVGLVVEDWLPKGANRQFDLSQSTPLRLTLAIAMVVALAGFALWISRSRLKNGTLYHVRLLSERAPDYHTNATGRAREQALGYRSITRSLALGHENWVDMVAVVAQARAELERQANADDASTSYELAPNAHWPIEFALGADWPMPDNTTLLEFHKEHPGAVFTVSADPAELPPIPSQQPSTEQRLVHLDIHLSDQDPITPAQLINNWNRIFARPADRVERWGVVRDSRQIQCFLTAANVRVPVVVGDQGMLSPTAAADATARAILLALDQFPHAHIVVTTRIPKAVAVLAGRHFATYLQRGVGERPQTGQTSPEMVAWRQGVQQSQHWNDSWRRLILLSFNESIQAMQALRVHPAQTSHLPRAQPDITSAVTLINLTPHDLVIFDSNDPIEFTLPRTTVPARLTEIRSASTQLTTGITSIPMTELSYATVPTGLPDPQPRTLLVVSRVTAQGLPERNDLVFPLDEVRDAQHRIIGCRGLGRLNHAGR
ncbi:hypothetical protein [Nocardia salmonicida]|uniref:hypothetical protein n=1 Tax=Nocardia salmonicida TaxID=53431 RepID=UPI003794470B